MPVTPVTAPLTAVKLLAPLLLLALALLAVALAMVKVSLLTPTRAVLLKLAVPS